MKKFYTAIILIFVSSFVFSQNFIVTGTVVSQNNTPVSNHQVCVYTLGNTSVPAFFTCVYTNNSGQYSLSIPGGGVIGPNQVFHVFTYDCNNDTIVQVVQSNQGTTVIANVNFVICQTGPCNSGFTYQISGLNVSFFASPINVTNALYLWSFGDGTTSSQMNPVHTYSGNGTYTVCLYVTIPGVCADTVCQTIVIGNAVTCNVSFTYNSSNTLPNQVQFYGTSNPVAVLSQWYWDFGDGTTLIGQQNPQHQYSSPGVYYVCVSLMMNGMIQCVYCDTVIVGNNLNCQASFSYNQSPNGIFTFAGQFNPVTGATQWLWDFGDSTTATGQTVSHVFPGPGTYNVCLTVVSTACPPVTVCQTVVVPGTNPCNVSFTYSTSNLLPNQVQFNGFSGITTLPSHWIWNFGDGITMTGIQNPVHQYAASGYYQVCVFLAQAGTIQCYYCDTILVGSNTSCQASFTYNQTPNGVFTFAGQFAPATTATQWLWNFGDGSSATGQTVSHIFSGFGNYNVCLTVISTVCPAVTTCQNISVGANTGGFGGQVIAGNQPADMGTVYLLSAGNGPAVNNLVPVASVPIDSNGYYLFSNIPFGNYIVQAHLSPGSVFFFDYLPTYYGDVLFWQQATVISVSSAGITIQYDIHLVGTSVIIPGNGQINGLVVNATGNKDISDVENVLIILLDNDDLPVKYTYSDANGYFEFTGLPWGNYKLQAEIWNKEPVSATILLNDDHPFAINVVITIHDNAVITSIPEKPNDLHFGELIVFPSPASEQISFILPAKFSGEINVKILSVSGVKIRESYFLVNESEARYSKSILDIPDGIYFLQITGNDIGVVNGKFVKHK